MARAGYKGCIAQSQQKWLKSNNSNTGKQNGSTKEEKQHTFSPVPPLNLSL